MWLEDCDGHVTTWKPKDGPLATFISTSNINMIMAVSQRLGGEP